MATWQTDRDVLSRDQGTKNSVNCNDKQMNYELWIMNVAKSLTAAEPANENRMGMSQSDVYVVVHYGRIPDSKDRNHPECGGSTRPT